MQTWWAEISAEAHPISGNLFFARRVGNMRPPTDESIFARLPRHREAECMACAATTLQNSPFFVCPNIEWEWEVGRNAGIRRSPALSEDPIQQETDGSDRRGHDPWRSHQARRDFRFGGMALVDYALQLFCGLSCRPQADGAGGQ